MNGWLGLGFNGILSTQVYIMPEEV